MARLISTILSKRFLNVKQIKQCMPSLNDTQLKREIEQQERYIKVLREEIASLRQKLARSDESSAPSEEVVKNAMEGVSQESTTSDPMDVTTDIPLDLNSVQKWVPGEGWKTEKVPKARPRAVNELYVQLPDLKEPFCMYIRQEGQDERTGPPSAPIGNIAELTAQDRPISATVFKAQDGTPTHLQLKFDR